MHPDRIVIRKASPGDNVLLAELGARTFQDTFGPANTAEDMADYVSRSFSPSQQQAELSDPSTVFLIAQAGEEVVGYARLRQGPAPAQVRASMGVEIVRLYAIQERIGRGVGHALMQACLDRADGQGNDVIWLDVWEHNGRARAFYRKWGFEDMGTQPFQLGNDLQNDILMARPVRRAHADEP
jgi:ribosomal protein S18 acetylase RimI-like enzyme